MTEWYSQVWGIQTGDVLSAAGAWPDLVVLMVSRPYFIEEYAASICVRTWPVIAAKCARKGRSLDFDRAVVVKGIRQIDSRYFTDQNAQVLIERPPGVDLVRRLERNLTAWPGDLERIANSLGDAQAPNPEPYQFDAKVDYSTPREVWKCRSCDRDFNAPFRVEYVQNSINRGAIGPCPRCGEEVSRRILTPYNLIFVLQTRPDPDTGTFSRYGDGWISHSGEHCPPDCEETSSFKISTWEQLLPGDILPWESVPNRRRGPW